MCVRHLLTGVCEVNLQNKAGYTAVMLASLTAPDSPADLEVVHRLMETADVNARSSQVPHTAPPHDSTPSSHGTTRK